MKDIVLVFHIFTLEVMDRQLLLIMLVKNEILNL